MPVPAWSVHATPYYWLNKDCVSEVLEQHRIDDYSEDAEQQVKDILTLTMNRSPALHGKEARPGCQ